MEFDDLKGTSGEWLRGTGPESDIVISSRIRLARNVADFTFPPRADESTRRETEALLKENIQELSTASDLKVIDVNQIDDLDRKFLVERQLISREHAESSGARSACIGALETVSLMINEEDHLRMQVFRSGYALESAWTQINRIDDELEERVSFAFSDEFGYLTSCPTNVGTGMRVSVMLHLPALVLTKEIQKVFQAMHKMNLAVRGLYGEGSQAMGDFYQISNQVTLGRTEEQIIQNVKRVIPDILDYERRARQALIKEDRQRLHDQVSRALGVLSSARQISSEETMEKLSSVRMGINLGLVDDIEISTVNELFMHIQPAHLQKIRGEELESTQRNVVRAAYLRDRLTRPPQN
ncbi:putative ATP:guanido phosphotransferase [Thalassoglobus neptunius]|uniref:Protein-arginine kinase n=1 Tax=Thalassoglobus neptunius TaxID=1938619 RepID=A0A5C5WJ27_9PLAN|nr:protein arginine kinase [Thalassoglobus neptunius]TWT50021.1 putative ATP:guanido phosphotransferase [Thalassoglobus neptunius]